MRRLIETLLLVFASMAIGMALYGLLGQGAFTLPSFIWALLVGAVMRNLLSFSGLYRVNDKAVETIGALSLSLFLAMIIMTLKLWELVDLAGPIIAILLVQTAVMLAYVAFVTFRVMGRNYDAALLATGHLGFSMGSTATAMVNVQAVAERYGHSPLAFLLIPVMGAFLIDVANALIIQGFLRCHGSACDDVAGRVDAAGAGGTAGVAALALAGCARGPDASLRQGIGAAAARCRARRPGADGREPEAVRQHGAEGRRRPARLLQCADEARARLRFHAVELAQRRLAGRAAGRRPEGRRSASRPTATRPATRSTCSAPPRSRGGTGVTSRLR